MKYKITNVQQRTVARDRERVVVMRVSYETELGEVGSVDLEKELFSVDEAKKAVEEEIKMIGAIRKMEGEV